MFTSQDLVGIFQIMKTYKLTSILAQICVAATAGAFVSSIFAQPLIESWVRKGTTTVGNGAMAVGKDGTIIVTGGTSDYLTAAYSSEGLPLWTNTYAGPWADDSATGATVSTNGNVFITGSSHGGSPNYLDYATIAYSHEGVPLWTNRYNGPGNVADTPTAIVEGLNGNIFVTGSSATLAYSPDGVPLWTNAYAGSGFSFGGRAMAIGADGKLIVSGKGSGYTTIAYTQDGIPLWTNNYGAGFEVTGMAVDTDGTVFVTGTAGSSIFDYLTVACSTDGAALWTNRYSGQFSNSDDRATGLALGTNGTVFVTGYSGSSGGPDYATIAYSHDGVPLWTNRYNGPAGHDYARSVVVDSKGDVIVTGSSFRTANSIDIATVAYSPEGVPLSTNRYTSVDNYSESAISVLAVPDGVVVAGYSILSRFGRDGTLIKYKTSVLGYNILSSQLLDEGTMKLSYLGTPNQIYVLDRTLDLAPANWIPQMTNASGADGALIFTNTPDSTANNFWRVRSLP